MYDTEYIDTTDMWAGDVDKTMYTDLWRTFRIPFELYHDIVEAAYDSGKLRDDMPGRKNKKRGAPPTPLTLNILWTLRVMALGCPMDGMRLESGISQCVLVKFFHKFTEWMVEEYFADKVHMPNDTAGKCGDFEFLAWAASLRG
jgi:hypothetical protein